MVRRPRVLIEDEIVIPGTLRPTADHSEGHRGPSFVPGPPPCLYPKSSSEGRQ